jgi:hypothetical protein
MVPVTLACHLKSLFAVMRLDSLPLVIENPDISRQQLVAIPDVWQISLPGVQRGR